MSLDQQTTQALTQAELEEFREIFSLVDRDGGGTISKDELKTLMSTLGIKATQVCVGIMVANR